MRKAFLHGIAWMFLCIILDFTPIPTVFLFLAGGFGMWWFTNPERVWPYVIIADTQKGKEVAFEAKSKKYVEKIANILCEALGIELARS